MGTPWPGMARVELTTAALSPDITVITPVSTMRAANTNVSRGHHAILAVLLRSMPPIVCNSGARRSATTISSWWLRVISAKRATAPARKEEYPFELAKKYGLILQAQLQIRAVCRNSARGSIWLETVQAYMGHAQDNAEES